MATYVYSYLAQRTLRRLNPAVFKEPRSDEFMLTMTDGTMRLH